MEKNAGGWGEIANTDREGEYMPAYTNPGFANRVMQANPIFERFRSSGFGEWLARNVPAAVRDSESSLRPLIAVLNDPNGTQNQVPAELTN